MRSFFLSAVPTFFAHALRSARHLTHRFGLLWALCVAVSPHIAMAQNLELGVLPNVSARLLLTQYQPMQTFLSQRLGRPVVVSTAPSWREFYQRTKAGQYDIVVAAGNVARLAETDLKYRPLLSYEPLVPGLFVTRKGESAAPAVLLKNQSLALANPASLVAFEGMRWLSQQGLEAGTQFNTVQVKGDDSVGSAIVRGMAVAGVMSMGEFRAHPPEIRDQLNIHTRFADVASFLVSVNPKVDATLAEQIKVALLEFGRDGTEGRAFFERTGFTGIVPLQASTLQKLDVHVDNTRKLLD